MVWLSYQADGGSDVLEFDQAREGRFTIGRNPENDLCLPHPDVSSRHALIGVKGGNIYIRDGKTRSGTRVNGEAIPEKGLRLSMGDTIEIGPYCLTMRDVPPEGGAPVPPPAEAPVDERPPVEEAPAPSPAEVDEQQAELDQRFALLEELYAPKMIELKRRIHDAILSKLKLTQLAQKDIENEEMHRKLEAALDRSIEEYRHEIGSLPIKMFRQSMFDELIKYGPIQPLLDDPTVSEVMVNGVENIHVERQGLLTEAKARFYDERHVQTIIKRIVEPLGRRIDESQPWVDARLPDGSRVNAVIHPVALDGPSITIRKFSDKKLNMDDLVNFKSMTPKMARFLEEAVSEKQNMLVSGGTGSGKTTLLNVLSLCIPMGERIVTIEDAAELKLDHRNLVRMETRPPNNEGQGRITIRQLVINSLRMRPDRIIVGECRGEEALDMLQAMNTGHDGSLTTAHANNPRDALMRLENMVMMAGYDLPSKAIKQQIASAVNFVVQQTRFRDGSRRIVEISEITGLDGDAFLMQKIFEFKRTGVDSNGKITGEYVACGNIPLFIEEQRRNESPTLPTDFFDSKAKD